MTKLYIDDLRVPPDNTWTVTRTYQSTIDFFEIYGLPETVSFDHDLGEEKSGYDIAKWIVDAVLDNKVDFPDNFEFKIHSANPVGAKNIRNLLNNFMSFLQEQKTTR